ncbi:hypothetical protein OF850_19800 [Roseococcus sp. MDT2-1-1]|uniref:Uncharacterized protein n=2 Tax=Sabulicella glaciei TaxID=2984948 RepID=A0ABT3P0B5_9PROT|nr:hypothetical protein [Roseococcus sp. MDT2-1-1]
MNGYHAREEAASREDDPDIPLVSCSSPPCFLRELSPSFLGPLTRAEILVLLENLLAVRWARTPLERAWLGSMLHRHIAQISGKDAKAASPAQLAAIGVDPSRETLRKLALDLRKALPRIEDRSLRRDLQDVLASLEHFLRRRCAALREEL